MFQNIKSNKIKRYLKKSLCRWVMCLLKMNKYIQFIVTGNEKVLFVI